MRLADSRKADISLSINAIVIIVIAFVVLGLALTLTRTIFSGALAKVPEALELTQLEAQPSADNPIPIPSTVEIKKGAKKTVRLGFYNRKADTAYRAKFVFKGQCLNENGNLVGTAVTNPSIASPVQDVPSSEAAAYALILTTSLEADTYICTIAVSCAEGIPACTCGAASCDYETQQFFLRVTS